MTNEKIWRKVRYQPLKANTARNTRESERKVSNKKWIAKRQHNSEPLKCQLRRRGWRACSFHKRIKAKRKRRFSGGKKGQLDCKNKPSWSRLNKNKLSGIKLNKSQKNDQLRNYI